MLERYAPRIIEKAPGTTGAISFFAPIAAYLETAVANMSDLVSVKSRLGNVAFLYCMMPLLLDGRQKTRELFRVTKESSELSQKASDAAYSAGISLLVRPAIYLASGETDIGKIVAGTLAVTAAGAVLGPVGLHINDYFSEAFGKEGKHLAPPVRKKKKRRAALFAAAALVAMTAVYALTDNPGDQEPLEESVKQEYVVYQDPASLQEIR